MPDLHYANRAQWLRAAMLGANDGIVSTASLIVGVDAASAGRKEILIAALAGWMAGATSMAAGEYVSVSSQADAEAAGQRRHDDIVGEAHSAAPTLAAFASATSYSIGAALPILTALTTATERMAFSVPVAAIVSLAALGAVGAWLGGARPLTPALRSVISGALAMAVTSAVGALAGGIL